MIGNDAVEEKLSVKDFAAKIKEKYPQYKEVDDFELSRRIVDKYPQYKDKVDLGGEQTQTEEFKLEMPGIQESVQESTSTPLARIPKEELKKASSLIEAQKIKQVKKDIEDLSTMQTMATIEKAKLNLNPERATDPKYQEYLIGMQKDYEDTLEKVKQYDPKEIPGFAKDVEKKVGLAKLVSNAVERGSRNAQMANILTEMDYFQPDPREKTDPEFKLQQDQKRMEAMQAIAGINADQSAQASRQYQRYMNAGSLKEAFNIFLEDPVQMIVELTAESQAALLKHGWSRMAAGGGIGLLAANPWLGMAAGMGVASSNLETAGAIMEGFANNGIDITDPKDLQKAFTDEELYDKIRSTAMTKGRVIGAFDAVSMGLAGKLITAPSKGVVKKMLHGLGELGIQMGMGAGGEAAAELASGQKLSPADILAEALGELGGAPGEVGGGILFNKNKSAVQQSREILANAKSPIEKEARMAAQNQEADMMVTAGRMTAQQGHDMKVQAEAISQADARVPQDMNDREDLVGLIALRDLIEVQKDQVDKSLQGDFDERLKMVNQAIEDTKEGRKYEYYRRTEDGVVKYFKREVNTNKEQPITKTTYDFEVARLGIGADVTAQEHAKAKAIEKAKEPSEGDYVDYGGITGKLAKNADGDLVVVSKDGTHVMVEGGLSGKPLTELGLSRLPAPEQPAEIDEQTAVPDGEIDYNFDTGEFSLYGKKFKYVSVEVDDAGNTTAIQAIDEDGKTKFIRNPDVVAEIEIQKEMAEQPDLTPEAIDQTAETLEIESNEEPKAEKPESAAGAEQVQQEKPTEDTQGAAEAETEVAAKEGDIVSYEEATKAEVIAAIKNNEAIAIPLSVIGGLEPQPAPFPTEKRAITEPIEVVLTNQGDVILEAGNHRYHQAVFNGDETIPAKVRLERGAEAHAEVLLAAKPEAGKITKGGFTEGKDLNKIYRDLKEKYGDKNGADIYTAGTRLVNPNENTIVEIRSNGVVVKDGDRYLFKAFTDTDFNHKKWRLTNKDIDVTDQFIKSAQPEAVKEGRIFYHGTDKEFDEFEPQGLGIHFGTEAQAKERGSRIVQAKLDVKNPFRMDDVGSDYDVARLADELVDAGLITKEEKASLQKDGTPEDIVSILKNNGYDSIVYKNRVENRGTPEDSYIVFDKSQIEAAKPEAGKEQGSDAYFNVVKERFSDRGITGGVVIKDEKGTALAEVELTIKNDNAVELENIVSRAAGERKGFGSKALGILKGIADETSTRLFLSPEPIKLLRLKGLDKKALIRFYEKNGFRYIKALDQMVYDPAPITQASKTAKPEAGKEGITQTESTDEKRQEGQRQGQELLTPTPPEKPGAVTPAQPSSMEADPVYQKLHADNKYASGITFMTPEELVNAPNPRQSKKAQAKLKKKDAILRTLIDCL